MFCMCVKKESLKDIILFSFLKKHFGRSFLRRVLDFFFLHILSLVHLHPK